MQIAYFHFHIFRSNGFEIFLEQFSNFIVFLIGFYYQNRRSANFYLGLADSQKIGRIAFLIYPYSVV